MSLTERSIESFTLSCFRSDFCTFRLSLNEDNTMYRATVQNIAHWRCELYTRLPWRHFSSLNKVRNNTLAVLNKQWCTLKFAHSLLDRSFGFRVTFCMDRSHWSNVVLSSPRTRLCGRLWSRTQLPADPCSQLNSHPVPVTQTPLRYYHTLDSEPYAYQRCIYLMKKL